MSLSADRAIRGHSREPAIARGRDGALVRLQPLVRARVAALGERGTAWVDGLPDLVAELATRWSLRPGRRLPGGSASYLTSVTRADGSEAVLKVALPEPGFAEAASRLHEADGRGFVAVLEVDEPARALLLERLGPALDRVHPDVDGQVRVLASALVDAWGPAAGAPSDRAAELAADVVRRHAQHPAVEDAVVEQALAYAAVLGAPGPADLVLVHGDPHPGNLLRVLRPRAGAERGWCFVDPRPFVGDRASDLGVAVRDFSATLLAEPATAAERLRGWCQAVAAPSGTDPERVWAWAYLERVWTGLYVTSFGAPRVGAPFLRSAGLLRPNC